MELGEQYGFKKEILPELVTGNRDSLIQPRVEKAREYQTNRSRDKAEVFTPSWICNVQNNLVDEQWFGRKNVFSTQKGMTRKAATDRITFPDDSQHTWQKYVDAQRLEISCWEALYLVSVKTQKLKKNGLHGQSGRSRASTDLSIRVTVCCWYVKKCL